MNLKIHEGDAPTLRAPVLIAGWPGMGSVGVGAVNYLRRALEGKPFAEIDLSALFTPEMVVVEEGIAHFPEVPSHVFYAIPNADLIVFESEAQVTGEGGIQMMREVLDFAEQMNVSSIYTAAAFAMPMSHTEPIQVLGVSNTESMRESLKPYGVEVLEQGHISGLNGLLLGFAASRNISASCLLATMPHHVIQMPNPKASRAILQVLRQILDVEVDFAELDGAVEQMGKVLKEIEEKIRSTFSAMQTPEDAEDAEELEAVDEEQVPQYVMQKIEHLFLEVSKSIKAQEARETAARLKQELDRWRLYDFYEDRFLNLFREDPSRDG